MTSAGWVRLGLRASAMALALVLGVASVWAQQATSSNKKDSEIEDIDATLDAFTSPDPGYTPAAPATLPPLTLFPVSAGSPFGFYPNRLGFYGSPLFNSYLPAISPAFPGGYSIAAIGPQGTPLSPTSAFGSSGSINPTSAYAGGDSFDVLKQPSEFKYTGSEIGVLYGFSSSGASIRAAGFVTSMASNNTQIYAGATFSDQSGLPFFNPFSPNRKQKLSAQTQQYFGGLNYKLAGGSMVIGIDFAVENTKLSGNFRSFNRNQPVAAASNLNGIGNGTTYGGQVSLSGMLPNNTGYQVGFGVDQTNGPDLTSLMVPRRR